MKTFLCLLCCLLPFVSRGQNQQMLLAVTAQFAAGAPASGATPFTPTNPAVMVNPAFAWFVPDDYHTNGANYLMPSRAVDHRADQWTHNGNNAPPDGTCYIDGYRFLSNYPSAGLWNATNPIWGSTLGISFLINIDAPWPPSANKFLFEADSGNGDPNCFMDNTGTIHFRGDTGTDNPASGMTSNAWYAMSFVMSSPGVSAIYTNLVLVGSGNAAINAANSGFNFPGAASGAQVPILTSQIVLWTNAPSMLDLTNLYIYWRTNFPSMSLPKTYP